MPAKRRLIMRQLRQMLRLAGSGTSSRDIAAIVGIASSTVQDNLKRAAAVGLNWPLPGELTDDALEHKLSAATASGRHTAAHGAELGRSCGRAQEARRHFAHPLGGVSRDDASRRATVAFVSSCGDSSSDGHRQSKVFVDCSGNKIPIVDRKTGEIREAEIFVAVLGASSHTSPRRRGRDALGINRKWKMECVSPNPAFWASAQSGFLLAG